MVIDKNKKRLPPYISFRTFLNFLEGLEEGVPDRIDRSYWGDKFSGGNGVQLMAALRFLGLIDWSGLPTEHLKELAANRGPRRVEVLRKVCTASFIFLQGNFNLKQATYAQLEDEFQETYKVDGDVSRKCIKFFIELANSAEIALSPFITKKSRTMRSNSGMKKSSKKDGIVPKQNLIVPKLTEQVPQIVPIQNSWKELLLSKFPTFDPTWPNDVQLKWFEAFDELLKRGFIGGNER